MSQDLSPRAPQTSARGAVETSLILPYPITPAPAPVRSLQPHSTVEFASLILDGSFEGGPDGPWIEVSAAGNELISTQFPHHGLYGAWLGGDDDADDLIRQAVAIPENASQVTLSYWWAIHTLEEYHPHDFCTVTISDEQGNVLQTVETLTDAAEPDVWRRSDFVLLGLAGQVVTLTFHAVTDATNPTDFFVDDVDLVACLQPNPGYLYGPLGARHGAMGGSR